MKTIKKSAQSTREVNKIITQIKKGYKPEKIILFGSFACGRAKENSDVDLVVIKKTKERAIRRMMRMAGIVKSPLGTDILVYTPREWDEALKNGDFFVREIEDNGKVIYGS